jgi:CHAT domain-containing protein/Tfp pilus assembly protein PilF
MKLISILFVVIVLPGLPEIYTGTFPNDSTKLSTLFDAANAFSQSEDYDSALVYYQGANRLAEEIGDLRNLIRSYNGIGATYIRLAEYATAYEYLTRGLILCEEHLTPDDPLVAGIYQNIGLVYRNRSDTGTARKYYLQALRIYETQPDTNPNELGMLNNNLGVLFFHEGQFDSSLVYLKKAADIRVDLYGLYHRLTGESYRNIAIIYNRRGKIDSAITYQQKAITIFTELYGELHPRVAESYSGLGYYRGLQGDNSIGLDYQHRALSIYQRILDTPDNRVASVYNSIGIIQHEIKDYTAAEESYAKAMAIRKEVVDETDITFANLYSNIGVLYADMGRYDEAVEAHLKSLHIESYHYEEQHPSIATTYNNLGYTYLRQGSFDESLDYLYRSVRIASDLYGNHHPSLARVYNNIGSVYEERDEYHDALFSYQHAIIASVPFFTDNSLVANPNGRPTLSHDQLLTALLGKARLLERRYTLNTGEENDMEIAFDTYRTAAELIQSYMTEIRTDESKISLADRVHDVYEGGIRTALKLNESTGDSYYINEAFRLAEANKSTVLWQVIADSKARTFSDIPDSVLQLEEELRRDISFYETETLKSEVGSDSYAYLSDAYISYKTRYDRLIDQIESDYPSYYELKHAVSIPEIEDIRRILPPNTALLQYFYGSTDLYIFAITPDTFIVARSDDTDTIAQSVSEMLYGIRMIEQPVFNRHAAELYTRLLLPIEPILEDAERLYIIPDGSLFYIPFETLIADDSGANNPVPGVSHIPYIIRKYEIVYHYSTRLFMRSLIRNDEVMSEKRYAGFAPVFSDEKRDHMMLTSQSAPDMWSLVNDDEYRTLIGNTGELAPLPHSREEIQSIAELFERYEKSALTFLYGNATEEMFKSVAGEYSIVHIASHGILHESNPKLSGIVFAPPDSDANEEDGILFAGEMFNLNLSTDLLVISSCESGTGEIVRGEGLLAMTRGFLFSGASNLVVSLWKVYDRHTHDLMIEFYKNILEGKRFSEALREAKLSIIDESPASFPLFWSGFILIGGV